MATKRTDDWTGKPSEWGFGMVDHLLEKHCPELQGNLMPLAHVDKLPTDGLWKVLNLCHEKFNGQPPHARRIELDTASAVAFELGSRNEREEFERKYTRRFTPKRGPTVPISEKDVKLMVSIHKKGECIKDIASAVKRNEDTVGRLIRKHCDCPKHVRLRKKKSGKGV